LAEIDLFLIFLGSIGFDLLIGDPRFLIHPVQIIGFYIKKLSDYLINNFGENKKILFWGGLVVAISTIGISFSFGKLIELSYVQSRNHFFNYFINFFIFNTTGLWIFYKANYFSKIYNICFNTNNSNYFYSCFHYRK